MTASDGTAADGTSCNCERRHSDGRPDVDQRIQRRPRGRRGRPGEPPGPVDIDITVGTTDETATLFTQGSEEDAPSSDPGTEATDYFWTIPANALTSIASSGSATVTMSSSGSDNFVPITNTFTLDW